MKKTKRNLLIVSSIIIIISVGLYFFSKTEEFYFLELKFKYCPNGHYSIKAIPILYGLIDPDSVLSEKIKKKEIYLGGCVISKNSPHYKIFCEKCGFELTQTDGGDFWERTSKDVNDFQIPLNQIIREFPIRSQVNYLEYFQGFMNGFKSKESVKYISSIPIAITEKNIRKFCQENNIDITENYLLRKSFLFGDKQILQLKYQTNSKEYLIELESTYRHNGSFISFYLTYKNSSKL